MVDSPLKDKVSGSVASNHIMHMSLKLGDGCSLMAMDYNPMFHKRQIGVNTALMLKPDTKEEAERLFKELSSNGGSVEDELTIQVSSRSFPSPIVEDSITLWLSLTNSSLFSFGALTSVQ